MRIVAGLAKGRRLATPAGPTRPTSDRAREGLFNSLGSLLDLDGARVLDLFAGTGAVGLEALSRGAGAADFVESDRKAAAVLRRNVETVGLPGARVHNQSVSSFLATTFLDSTTVLGTAPQTSYDVVFADPPYALDDDAIAEILTALTAGSGPQTPGARPSGRLSPGAVLVVERSSRTPAPRWPDCVTPLRERRYGEGVLWYGRAR